MRRPSRTPTPLAIEQVFYDRGMARGGYGAGTGVPLRDRARAGGTLPDQVGGPTAEVAGPGGGDRGCPARHCWITVPPDATEARPALLLQWRKGELGRFEGLVVYAAQLRPGRWATVTEWVPAELLAAADG